MSQGNQEHLMSREEKNQKKSSIQNVHLHAFKYILVALLVLPNHLYNVNFTVQLISISRFTISQKKKKTFLGRCESKIYGSFCGEFSSMYVHHNFIKSIIFEGRTSFTELQCTTLMNSLFP